jgi:ADP-ribose pyrophosphatase YjhB (NUDIX family)
MLRIIIIIVIFIGLFLSFIYPEKLLLTALSAIGFSVIATVILSPKKFKALNTDIFLLYYKWKINKIFISQDIDENSLIKLDEYLFNILKKKPLDKVFIESVEPEINTAILLTLQNTKISYGLSTALTNHDFKTNARRASTYTPYKKLLLKKSLRGINISNTAIEDNLLQSSECSVGDDLKQVSDDDFLVNLKETDADTLVIFSTTSQLSSDLIEVLVSFPECVSKIEFFVCSPFIESDNAISALKKEYTPPDFCIPKGQFITSVDGHVDIEMDCVRRVMRILSSISRLKAFSRKAKVQIEVNFFKQEYPGIKVKSLSKNNYLQIQPGPLSFANNMYRFGVNTSDSKVCREISKSIEIFKNDNEKIQTINLNSQDIKILEVTALKELALWLLERGVTPERIEQSSRDILLKTSDVLVKPWIDSIFNMLKNSRNSIQSYSFDHPNDTHSLTDIIKDGTDNLIFSDSIGHAVVHKTVALIIVRDDSVLLIEKSDPAYDSKYSIVAGHLNNNESANQAIIREVNEEIGLLITEPEFLFKMEKINDTCRHGGVIHDWYVYYYSEYLDISTLTPDKSEIKKFKWIKLTELNSMKDNLTMGCRTLFKAMGHVT